MLSFKLNIDSHLFDLSESKQKEVVSMYLKELQSNWIQLAQQNLQTAQQQYVSGIQISESKIELVGDLPNMIESGAPSFDMKESFKKSSKVKYGKKGWYLIIPMQHATKSSISAPKMPRSVYEAIKKSKARSLSANELPKKYNKIGVSQTGYEHKSPKFAGLTKTPQGKSGRNTYNTFRVVSANSDPNSWIHPGFQAKNLVEQAMNSVDIDKILSSVL